MEHAPAKPQPEREPGQVVTNDDGTILLVDYGPDDWREDWAPRGLDELRAKMLRDTSPSRAAVVDAEMGRRSRLAAEAAT
ncbi:hypothetical protein [Mycolicibacterium frederiksbergense]|uniref:hypothetical protein n=1 Tax=Mycolicibacterium frederiksbergense TaxID=117567 RepID=UPI001F192D25|nr:hypothetical protein [Mycolicibacterium frederiksbergense]